MQYFVKELANTSLRVLFFKLFGKDSIDVKSCSILNRLSTLRYSELCFLTWLCIVLLVLNLSTYCISGTLIQPSTTRPLTDSCPYVKVLDLFSKCAVAITLIIYVENLESIALEMKD